MSDPVRIYLRDLRIKQGISQEKVADQIGWSSRSFSDWETGKSGDIKSRYLIRLVLLLRASWDQIVHLEMDDSVTPELPDNVTPNTTVQSHEDEEFEQLVSQLRIDTELRTAFLVFWAGWKARKP